MQTFREFATKTYAVTRDIAAPPLEVWAVLTDADRLRQGDYGIAALGGALTVGSQIGLRAEIAPKQTFKLRVTLP